MKRSCLAALGLVTALGFLGCAQQSQMESGWVTLLDGGSGLENWNRVGTANWRVVDGVVQADKSEKGGSFLVSKRAFKDFELRVEFWVSDDANSGIYMRCQDLSKITDKTCYEANIFDQRTDQTYATGAIVHIAPPVAPQKAGGKWNVYTITARGTRMTLVLNGVQTAETNQAQFVSGPIALQWARGVVKFRKVQIRTL